MKSATTILVLLLFAVFATSLAIAQDLVKVEPNKYKLLFENERARILEFRDKPSDKSITHVHQITLCMFLRHLRENLFPRVAKLR